MSNRSIGVPFVTGVVAVALAGNSFGGQGVQMAPAAPLPDGPLIFDSSSPALGGRALPGTDIPYCDHERALPYVEQCESLSAALKRKLQLKPWSRAKKEVTSLPRCRW